METKELLEELKKKNDLYYDSLDLSKVDQDNFLVFLCLEWPECKSILGISNMKKAAGHFLEVKMYGYYNEKGQETKMSELKFQQLIHQYKPTALFSEFRRRKEWNYHINSNLVVITWLDNISELLFSGNSFLRNLNRFDVIVVPGLTFKEKSNIDEILMRKYKNHVIEVPFTARCDIFVPQLKTDSDTKKCDICVMGGSGGKSRIQSYLNGYLKLDRINNTDIYNRIMNIYENIVNKLYKIIRETERPVTDDKVIINIVNEEFAREKTKLNIENMNMQYSLSIHILSNYVYREVVYEWIVEKNYSVLFYGRYYEINEKFKKYSRPQICNLKDLRKAYQEAKICLNTNCSIGIHRTLFESILCGTLYLKPKTIPIYELSDADIFFKEDENIVCYGNKQELYHKIDWYLSHEEDRKSVVVNGQKVIKEKKLDLSQVYMSMMNEIIIKIQFLSSYENLE